MNRTVLLGGLLLAFCALMAVSGCGPAESAVAVAQPPAIPVSEPVSSEVTDFMEFTGRTEAVQMANIVPRVTGYLISAPFREGAEVKKDDLLFEIDPKPYQAQYDQANSQVALYQAQVKEAEADYNRNKLVAQRSPGSVTQQDLDRYEAILEESNAAVKAAKASLEIYRINLGYCKVFSPIDGQVSRYYLTVGNLVNQDQTQLTTVVSLDPMYVYFDMDETTLRNIRTAINEHRIERYQQWATAGLHRAERRRRISARRTDQLREQSGQRRHGKHHRPRLRGESEARWGHARHLSGDVRAGAVADRQAASGPVGDRSRAGI